MQLRLPRIGSIEWLSLVTIILKCGICLSGDWTQCGLEAIWVIQYVCVEEFRLERVGKLWD